MGLRLAALKKKERVRDRAFGVYYYYYPYFFTYFTHTPGTHILIKADFYGFKIRLRKRTSPNSTWHENLTYGIFKTKARLLKLANEEN